MNEPGRLLLLLRHAKAVAASHGMSEASDHARPLSERGRADAASMGRLLRARGLIPRRALVSTSLRTRETFALLGAPPGDAPGSSEMPMPEPVFSEALYLAEPRTLLDTLREQENSLESILLIGHNPGMQELAAMLASDPGMLQAGFPTCMLAVLRLEGAWSELAPRRAALRELLRP